MPNSSLEPPSRPDKEPLHFVLNISAPVIDDQATLHNMSINLQNARAQLTAPNVLSLSINLSISTLFSTATLLDLQVEGNSFSIPIEQHNFNNQTMAGQTIIPPGPPAPSISKEEDQRLPDDVEVPLCTEQGWYAIPWNDRVLNRERLELDKKDWQELEKEASNLKAALL